MNKLKIPAMIMILICLSVEALTALDTKGIIAYPVPYNPRKVMALKISNPGSNNMTLEIFDINGDLVCKRSGSSDPVIWNGRNTGGNYVKPGMYIIKVTAENSSTGDYGKKTIRILVDY